MVLTGRDGDPCAADPAPTGGRALANPEVRTERQLDIVALLADGPTNAEIGAKLFHWAAGPAVRCRD